MPDSLGFSSRQRPEHPRPASYPTPEQPATRRMRSPFPASNEIPAKQIASKHPTPSLSSGPLPDTPPPPPGNSQPAIRPLRQFPTTPRPCVYKPRPKHAQAPTSSSPALRASGNPPSAQQSSEHRAILRTRPLLSPPNARPHRRSDTPAPEIPNTARYPEIPKFLPVSLHPDSQPRHPETQKKRSRHCAGSAPNYLQVSTRSYLSRSESGSGSCSSPYC